MRDDGTASLVHVIQIQNEEVNSWYEAYVDAHTGELISLTDFVAEATVRRFDLTLFHPVFTQTLFSTQLFPLTRNPFLMGSRQ